MIVDRIHQIIEHEGISRLKFYKKVGLSNGFLDKVKDVGSSKLELILKAYPNINPTWLVTGKGSMLLTDIGVNNAELSFVSEPGFVYQSHGDVDNEYEEFTNKNGNKFFIHKDSSIEIEVPLMSEPAYASYMEQFFDDTFIADLDKIKFEVDQIGKGNYMGFVIKNNSMWNGGEFDTKGGSKILGREIGRHLWSNGFHKTDYGFILMTSTGIFHKDVEDYNENTGMLTLSSRNPEVDAFSLNINEVNKVFNVIKRAF